MAEVKWIKITTTIFDDEKMKLIDVLPENDAIIVIWFKLLALAGKTNDDGYVYVMKGMATTDEVLSTVFNRPLSIIRLALETFTRFGMIEVNHHINIINWEKHQNIDGLDKIREQNRIRQEKHREKKKSNVTVTLSNGTEEDKNKNKNKIKEEDKEKDNKIKYAENVSMTEKEYQKLIEKYNKIKTHKMIEILDNYKGANGKKYTSDYRAILSWVVNKIETQSNSTNNSIYGEPEVF